MYACVYVYGYMYGYVLTQLFVSCACTLEQMIISFANQRVQQRENPSKVILYVVCAYICFHILTVTHSD